MLHDNTNVKDAEIYLCSQSIVFSDTSRSEFLDFYYHTTCRNYRINIYMKYISSQSIVFSDTSRSEFLHFYYHISPRNYEINIYQASQLFLLILHIVNSYIFIIIYHVEITE